MKKEIILSNTQLLVDELCANHIGKKLLWLVHQYGRTNYSMNTKFRSIRLFLFEKYPKMKDMTRTQFFKFLILELERMGYPYGRIET